MRMSNFTRISVDQSVMAWAQSSEINEVKNFTTHNDVLIGEAQGSRERYFDQERIKRITRGIPTPKNRTAYIENIFWCIHGKKIWTLIGVLPSAYVTVAGICHKGLCALSLALCSRWAGWGAIQRNKDAIIPPRSMASASMSKRLLWYGKVNSSSGRIPATWNTLLYHTCLRPNVPDVPTSLSLCGSHCVSVAFTKQHKYLVQPVTRLRWGAWLEVMMWVKALRTINKGLIIRMYLRLHMIIASPAPALASRPSAVHNPPSSLATCWTERINATSVSGAEGGGIAHTWDGRL